MPTLRLPDARIAEVYLGNWLNTLQPCQGAAPLRDPDGSGAEPKRPWRVDVPGHYPGWYPGVDVKHLASAYLCCEKNLGLVLRAWDLTTRDYLMNDGAVKSFTFRDNPHPIVPEMTLDRRTVFYPLRCSATIDYLLLADLIFRFSQDKSWLEANLPQLRRAAAYLERWTDPEGLLHSDAYDVDQFYREIDGVAQASAHLAFQRLAALEGRLGHDARRTHCEAVAARLRDGANQWFWDEALGYYYEHLILNNVAQASRLGSIGGVSSEHDARYTAARVLDGVVGMGLDAFGAGGGAGGSSEWATLGEGVGAWIQVNLREPTRLRRVILYNRTDSKLKPCERFAAGRLEFSAGAPPVEVTFDDGAISRAVAEFPPRTVTWVKFIATRLQAEGPGHPGLAEFLVLPADEPYRKVTHGMTDANFAMVGYGVADDARAARVWRHFKDHERAFYEVNGVSAPTWGAERPDTYGPEDLNHRAPRKDCVAMGRTWRHDAWMRHRMGDGDGLYQTLLYACGLYDRPSGGGAGFFGERYGLGRFHPGDIAEASIPQYAEYPAVFNSTIVQHTLLGLDADVTGAIVVDPCVPRAWYDAGFGQEGCGVRHDRDLGFTYRADRIDGWLSGAAGTQRLRLKLPPGLVGQPLAVRRNGRPMPHKLESGFVVFDLEVSAEARASFDVMRSVQKL